MSDPVGCVMSCFKGVSPPPVASTGVKDFSVAYALTEFFEFSLAGVGSTYSIARGSIFLERMSIQHLRSGLENQRMPTRIFRSIVNWLTSPPAPMGAASISVAFRMGFFAVAIGLPLSTFFENRWNQQLHEKGESRSVHFPLLAVTSLFGACYGANVYLRLNPRMFNRSASLFLQAVTIAFGLGIPTEKICQFIQQKPV